MDSLINVIIYTTSFLVMLSILVFVHEWGHFIVARMNGVKVDVFSIGFGREIWGWTDKKGTRWKFSYVPLGGYVKFFGDASSASTPEADLDDMSDEEKKVSFHHKKLYQRAAIVFAGPLVNFIFAILILATFFLLYGQVNIPPIVSEVMQNSAASEAGIQKGDVFVEVEGTDISRFNDVRMEVLFSSGESLDVEVLRGGKIVKLVLTPRLTGVFDEDGKPRLDDYGKPRETYQIGVRPGKLVIRQHNVGTALWAGVTTSKMIVTQSLRAMRQMVIGSRSVKELSGPVGIGQAAGKAAKLGLGRWVELMALISISLGMINLFPIPLLDGGHLLFYGFEAVLGRKLSARTQEYGFRIGLVFILGLMILATFNDILKFNW